MTAADDARRAAKNAANRAYRARQKAARTGKVSRGVTPHGGGIVERAQADAARIRAERDRVLRLLPNALSIDKNTPAERAARIRPNIDTGRAQGPPVKSKRAQEARAAAIRKQVNAERVAGIGRSRKDKLRIELTDGPLSEELQEMPANDRARFAEFTERIGAGSAQSIGILFRHGGGQDIYNNAIEKIRYKPLRDAGFDLLESLAEAAEKAAELYSPASLKRMGLGDAQGRLNI